MSINKQTRWVELYRPNTISDLVLDKITLNKLKKIIHDLDMPNIIITGTPGIGKTTTALCLAKGLFGKYIDIGVLELNASDDRGSKGVQDKMINFCKKKIALNGNGNDTEKKYADHKIIILDEADNMTSKAQKSLNKLIEEYKSTRFIFTCNKSSDIIEAVQSKCIIFRYKRLNDIQIINRLEFICKEQKVKFEKDALYSIASLSQGDLRYAINVLQMTFDGFVNVTVKHVSITCDKPQPHLIKDVLIAVYNKQSKLAIKLLLELKDKGYSGSDIALGMFNTLKMSNYIDFSDDVKIKFNNEICKTAINISKGIDTELQLVGCICNLCLQDLKN